jgi:16S rRNA (cytosine1402-N4)-methyltransferase
MHAHRPVLLDEALAGLSVATRPAGVFVDGTYGRGGHSGAILAGLAPAGALHAFDQDPAAAADAARFASEPRFRFHATNFAEMARIAAVEGFIGKVDGLLLDLGVSSPQLDEAARGFSFAHDGPLDMRMNPGAGESAAQWLARAPAEEIANVLYAYGEERNSRRIAARIVESRAETPLTSTAQLAALIASVPGPRSHKIHPATRSFQAIRIHINAELDVLRAALAASLELLAPGGRLAVISFHSLEDRIVKSFLRDAGSGQRETKTNKYAQFSKAGFADTKPTSGLDEIARVFPGAAEIAANPRARSAVLRVAELRA